MKVKSKNINSDTHFRILVAISENPDITQRELAKELGVSLGRINYCIKALVEIGFIKLINFKNNPNKINYLYVLTPSGISQKTLLIKDFLKRKIAEYELLEKEKMKWRTRPRHEKICSIQVSLWFLITHKACGGLLSVHSSCPES